MRLGGIDEPPHLPPLLLGQIDVPRGPVLLESGDLGRARDGDHALRGDPGERDLRRRAAPLRRERLDPLDDGLVLVEVVALELGD